MSETRDYYLEEKVRSIKRYIDYSIVQENIRLLNNIAYSAYQSIPQDPFENPRIADGLLNLHFKCDELYNLVDAQMEHLEQCYDELKKVRDLK